MKSVFPHCVRTMHTLPYLVTYNYMRVYSYILASLVNQTHFSAGRLSIGDYKRPAAKGSGQLPIPFLFCKIDRFCRLLIGVNQLLRCEKKPLISVDCLADDVEAEMRVFYSNTREEWLVSLKTFVRPHLAVFVVVH